MTTLIWAENFIINSDFTIILPIMRGKNTVEIVDTMFLKMEDQSSLVKIVLITHHKYSQADIAHNSVNRSHAEQRTRTNQRIQTNRLLILDLPLGYMASYQHQVQPYVPYSRKLKYSCLFGWN